MLPSTALLHPVQRPDPLFWLDSTKVVLLAMQIGGDIMAHESEKGRNGKGFVAVAHDTVVDGMFMEVDAEPCDERIDRNHQQDSDNTAIEKKKKDRLAKALSHREDKYQKRNLLSLLDWLAVMRRMAHDQIERHPASHQGEDGADEESQMVKGEPTSP